MEYSYVGYEVHYPSHVPTEEGAYFGKTPILEQALDAARAINGTLYGITTDGQRIIIWY